MEILTMLDCKQDMEILPEHRLWAKVIENSFNEARGYFIEYRTGKGLEEELEIADDLYGEPCSRIEKFYRRKRISHLKQLIAIQKKAYEWFFVDDYEVGGFKWICSILSLNSNQIKEQLLMEVNYEYL